MRFDPEAPSEPDVRLERYEKMRRHGCPVDIGDGVFFASRHEDVCAVTASDAFRAGGYSIEEHHLPSDQKVLSETDPPLHTVLRKVFLRLITPRRIRQYEPLVRACFEEAIDRVAPAGRMEVVADVARIVPARIIGLLADLDDETLPRVADYAADYIAGRFQGDEEARQRAEAFDARVTELIAERRAATERADDWLSVLLDCEDEAGRPLSDERLTTMFTKDLLVGGSETTRHVIPQLLLDVLSTSGAYDRLDNDRSLVPVAVEESLRLHPSLAYVLRRATRDVDIAGVSIPREAVVVLGLECANRDPDKFRAPQAFDLERGADARTHLTFSQGAHYCIGAPLARLELETFLLVLLDRFSKVELAPDEQIEYVPAEAHHGARLKHLEVTVDLR